MPAFLGPLVGLALGVALAWLGRPDVDQEAPLWDRPALAVALFASLVYAPVAAYFLIFAGDWAFAYLINSRSFPSALSLVLVVVDAASVVFGFTLGRRALQTRSLFALGWLALAPFGVALVLVFLLHRRLGVDATFDQVQGDFGQRPLPGSPLGYAILWMDAAVVAGAVFTARALSFSAPVLEARSSEEEPRSSEPPVPVIPIQGGTDEPPRLLGRGRRR
jgi:hypothetical protein